MAKVRGIWDEVLEVDLLGMLQCDILLIHTLMNWE